jgi:hypothetical protein
LEDKLKTLIAYYEEEKSRLLKLIDDCLKDDEYQLAHFHQQALYQLNGRLQTLQNIDDIFYDEKSHKQKWITVLEKRLEEATSDDWKEYLNKDLQRHKEELEKLNQSSQNKIASENENILDKTILDLLERKIKGFKLILKKADNFLLEFSYRKKALKVVLPNIRSLTNKWTLHEDNINTFINLGFVLIDNQSKLVLQLTGEKEAIIQKLRIILSKIVFEIFYFKEFQNETYIQIKTKASR